MSSSSIVTVTRCIAHPVPCPVPILSDDAGKPQDAVRLAGELLDDQKVDFLAGGFLSGKFTRSILQAHYESGKSNLCSTVLSR